MVGRFGELEQQALRRAYAAAEKKHGARIRRAHRMVAMVLLSKRNKKTDITICNGYVLGEDCGYCRDQVRRIMKDLRAWELYDWTTGGISKRGTYANVYSPGPLLDAELKLLKDQVKELHQKKVNGETGFDAPGFDDRRSPFGDSRSATFGDSRSATFEDSRSATLGVAPSFKPLAGPLAEKQNTAYAAPSPETASATELGHAHATTTTSKAQTQTSRESDVVSPDRFQLIRGELLEWCGWYAYPAEVWGRNDAPTVPARIPWTEQDSALAREFGVKTQSWDDSEISDLLQAVSEMLQSGSPARVLSVALQYLRGDYMPGLSDRGRPLASSTSPPRRKRESEYPASHNLDSIRRQQAFPTQPAPITRSLADGKCEINGVVSDIRKRCIGKQTGTEQPFLEITVAGHEDILACWKQELFPLLKRGPAVLVYKSNSLVPCGSTLEILEVHDAADGFVRGRTQAAAETKTALAG